jgi:hypothetical protein
MFTNLTTLDEAVGKETVSQKTISEEAVSESACGGHRVLLFPTTEKARRGEPSSGSYGRRKFLPLYY